MGQPALATQVVIELSNPYDILAQQGSGAADRDSDRLSFGSVSGANTTTSGSRGSRGRDPIPLTPKILHLSDRLELDKGKQARLITEHLTGQRQPPSTEQELQQHLEERLGRRNPAFVRLIPYTPVPLIAIGASEFRRLRPKIYELLTSLIEEYHSFSPPQGEP